MCASEGLNADAAADGDPVEGRAAGGGEEDGLAVLGSQGAVHRDSRGEAGPEHLLPPGQVGEGEGDEGRTEE